MLLTSAALIAQLLSSADSIQPATIHSGRERQLSVRLQRIETEIVVDGNLDEDVWRRASLLTGFSQYAPSDGLPAADSTQVLVWYAPGAIHFGIRAFESHGSATATLADRDRIFGDDNIQILLGTFHDGRQALMFAVNPRGVQADGALVEGRNTGIGDAYINTATRGREQADLSPDFVFQSRGHVTAWGYEVEIRIPFKSLRYQPAPEQRWHLNVVRQVKHSGLEDSWAPALRTAPSFIGQMGELIGLHGLRRGLVMDLNPELTQSVSGAPGTTGYEYSRGDPQLGGNVRWGITNSLNLNGTIHPDFSQVESDAGQFLFDPRQEVFYPEKRPFFLEGSELFTVPNNLIYTRRIVQPAAAVRFTGNISGMNVGMLSAVDSRYDPGIAENAVFNILRLQRNVGAQSRIGLAYTDRIDGDDFNRVADIDGRLVFSRITSLSFQLAGSHTRRGGVTTTAPLWSADAAIRGRTLGVTALFTGIGDDFQTRSGFLVRTGIVRANIDPSLTVYGRRGAVVERFTADLEWDGTWQYRSFINGLGIQDNKFHFRFNSALRGGWTAGAALLLESFGYDGSLYANYRIEVPVAGGLDTIPFVGRPRIPNLDWVLQAATPQWQHFSGSAFYLWGRDENFFEWASGDIKVFILGLNYRPTDRLRSEFTNTWIDVHRRTDGSRVNVRRNPRLKIEYQVSRPLFVRVVGQYLQEWTDSLRDDSRTNAPILIFAPTAAEPNRHVRTAIAQTNLFHADVLVSYQPIPGTVILAGYGSNLDDSRAFKFERLTRNNDAFFAKVGWLFRL